MFSLFIFVILYSISIVLAFLACGLFLVKFPHDKFWFTRELELADEGRRFKKNASSRTNVFVFCLVWPISGTLLAILASCVFLAMVSDKAFCFIMEKLGIEKDNRD